MNDHQKKILIVEDERPMARALDLKLTHAGFEVQSAFDGEEALKKIGEEKYDLVLLDLIMPKLDGFAVLEGIKNKGITVPVIVLSNLGQKEDEEKAKKLGAWDYLIKSNTPISEIVKEVSKALEVWN
jgi:DNA-binding response OmpR family regulator